MTVTVVTARSYTGVPMQLDVYRAAAGYVTTNGDLQVMSPHKAPLAFYGSGSWLSVFVEEAVEVLPGAGTSSSGQSPAVTGTAVTGTAVDAGPSRAPGSADGAPAAPAAPADPADPAALAAPAGTATGPGAARGVAAARPVSRLPRGMRAVVVRPRSLAPQDAQPAPAPRTRLRPVSFRARDLDPSSEPAPPAPRPRLRPVVIRKDLRPPAPPDDPGTA